MTFFQKHAYGFGCGLAAAFWPLFRKRRRISVDNLLRCGVASDETEARRIADVRQQALEALREEHDGKKDEDSLSQPGGLTAPSEREPFG